MKRQSYRAGLDKVVVTCDMHVFPFPYIAPSSMKKFLINLMAVFMGSSRVASVGGACLLVVTCYW